MKSTYNSSHLLCSHLTIWEGQGINGAQTEKLKDDDDSEQRTPYQIRHKLTWKYFLPPLHSPVRLQLLQQLVSDDLRDDALWENREKKISWRFCGWAVDPQFMKKQNINYRITGWWSQTMLRREFKLLLMIIIVLFKHSLSLPKQPTSSSCRRRICCNQSAL